MVRTRYPGWLNPKEKFDALAPYRRALLDTAMAYRPGGAEYMALHRAVHALDDAAHVVLNDRSYFHLKPHSNYHPPAGGPRERG